MSLRKVIESLRKNKVFLVTSHTNLEGDALGSELAMYRLLRRLGKDVMVVDEDAPPVEYNFLPDLDVIRHVDKHTRAFKFDCFVAVDCADAHRSGEVSALATDGKLIVNIDHHMSNTRFGSINWIKPFACSCSEMMYDLYKAMGVSIDRETALLLYTGIMTDTGSFRYPNTNRRTHEIVADLLRYKFDVTAIHKSVYENVAYEDMRFLASILPAMHLEAGGKLVWFAIKKELLKEHRRTAFDLGDHVLGFARAIRGVEVAVLFKENLSEDNEVRVNFRSQGNFDVNAVAASFGGGGHRTASGATIKGDIDVVRKKVLTRIKMKL